MPKVVLGYSQDARHPLSQVVVPRDRGDVAAILNRFAKPKDWTMKVTCACCRFFSPKSVAQPRHECHRRAPVPRLGQDGRHDEFGIGVWPIVLPEKWCGEFKRLVVTRNVVAAGTNGRTPR